MSCEHWQTEILIYLKCCYLQFVEEQGIHIARLRDDVYPGRPELMEYTIQLVPGWWRGTNIANRDKMRIIEKACEVERLIFGKNISISLPNTK
jgi:hypothetical protein